ncbi:MAG: hypothetical protein LKF80_14955 [Brevundimonas sp.]|jgi:4-carboxymuconolactone decarboxylase|uniref:carboxymuconolactone decarboxylase family protein n=1 Tax=Brevundimonas sp. TaxID=1871086 RepID=UPI0025C36E42|nr:hypothetical protein [Brevundimonas sp.]MCH4269694.1 hypothetical protein [Brevundimonas sp.]
MTSFARLAPLSIDMLSDEQRQVYDEIVTGPRGGIAGPFDPWLRSPKMAQLAQRLGAFCRFGTTLEPVLSELAILIVAYRHKAQIEWVAHAPIAIAAGLPEEVAEAIRQGRPASFEDPRMALVADVATALMQTSRLPDALYARARAELGEQALVELIGVLGYYSFVALTLNVFQPPMPGGAEKPFPDYS